MFKNLKALLVISSKDYRPNRKNCSVNTVEVNTFCFKPAAFGNGFDFQQLPLFS